MRPWASWLRSLGNLQGPSVMSLMVCLRCFGDEVGCCLLSECFLGTQTHLLCRNVGEVIVGEHLGLNSGYFWMVMSRNLDS